MCSIDTSVHECQRTRIHTYLGPVKVICRAQRNEEKKQFGKDTTTDLTHVHVPTKSVNPGNMPSRVELPTGVRGKVQPANAAAPLPPSAHIWAAHFRPSFPAKDQYKGPQLHPSFISWSSSVQQHEGKPT